MAAADPPADPPAVENDDGPPAVENHDAPAAVADAPGVDPPEVDPPEDADADAGARAGADLDDEPSGATLPSDDIEALLAAAAAGSVQMPPEDDDGTDPEPLDEPRPPTSDAAPGLADGKPDESAPPEEPPPAEPGRPAMSIPVGGQVEKLLEEVEAEVRRGRRSVLPAGQDPPEVFGATSPLELESFREGGSSEGDAVGSLGTLDDVELDLRIELGRAEMTLEEVVSLRDGSVVTLDKLAGDPVDILVNGRLVARGEVLVLNDNFCVRVAEILAPDR